jgi:hypothetical protein
VIGQFMCIGSFCIQELQEQRLILATREDREQARSQSPKPEQASALQMWTKWLSCLCETCWRIKSLFVFLNVIYAAFAEIFGTLTRNLPNEGCFHSVFYNKSS